MPASRRSNITIDAQNLSQFFLHAANVIGEENVSRDATYGALEDRHGKSNYGDPFAGYEKHKPSGAVRPSSVPELQAIVKLANRFGIPLWTVSRGKNLS
jgi:FAD/FMN-containing dehydrogenase